MGQPYSNEEKNVLWRIKANKISNIVDHYKHQATMFGLPLRSKKSILKAYKHLDFLDRVTIETMEELANGITPTDSFNKQDMKDYAFCLPLADYLYANKNELINEGTNQAKTAESIPEELTPAGILKNANKEKAVYATKKKKEYILSDKEVAERMTEAQRKLGNFAEASIYKMLQEPTASLSIALKKIGMTADEMREKLKTPIEKGGGLIAVINDIKHALILDTAELASIVADEEVHAFNKAQQEVKAAFKRLGESGIEYTEEGVLKQGHQRVEAYKNLTEGSPIQERINEGIKDNGQDIATKKVAEQLRENILETGNKADKLMQIVTDNIDKSIRDLNYKIDISNKKTRGLEAQQTTLRQLQDDINFEFGEMIESEDSA